MGLFSKRRKDAKWIRPQDSIGAIMPFIMPKRTDAEVSSKVVLDVTKLCEYVDRINESGTLEYKMTYFQALATCVGKTLYNREALNRFVKDKRLYLRNSISIGFVAKDKFKDNAEEKMICLDLKPNDDIFSLTHKMAIDVFKVRKEGSNDMDDVLKFFTSLPKWILSIIVKIVMILDEKGINPKFITEGDLNYTTVLLSNLGSIKTDSCYHHLNNYGTNSIVMTIGTIKETEGKKTVDVWATLDERISDGFYFARSIQLIQYIALHPELLEERLSSKVNYDEEDLKNIF